jgi:hypothetical protein
MELVLVAVSIVSFVIATGMSLIAWRLLRDEDGRSAARVALLQESVQRLEAAGGDTDAPATRAGDVFDVFARETPAFIDHADAMDAPAVPVQSSVPAPVPTPVPAPLPSPAHATSAALHFDDADPWDFKKESGTGGRPVRRAPALPLRPLRPAGVDVVIPATAMLFQTAPGVSRSLRRGAAIGVVVIALLMVTGVASVFALRNGGLAALTDRAGGAASGGNRPLELISLEHVREADGTFTVSGVVQNPDPAKVVAGVGAIVQLYDSTGQLVGTGRASIARTALPAGETSTFVVRVPHAPEVSRYRVGFRTKDDATVPHVDRRDTTGEAPGGPPTGDADEARDVDAAQPRLRTDA